MSSAGGSFAHLSFHIRTGWRVRCMAYADTTPILSVDAGSLALSITPAGSDATDEALEFARALAREAQAFADEIERMRAAQLADDDSSDDSTTKAPEGKAA